LVVSASEVGWFEQTAVHKTARNGGVFFFAAAIKMFVRKAISTQADKSPPTEREQPTFEKERPN